MRADEQLQRDVLAELALEPSVDASRIGVTANDGIVALTGFVPSYVEKQSAERVTKRVYGVKGVANDIEVRLGIEAQRTDGEIAKAAVDALRWNASVPDQNIKVVVEKGWVTLEGKVDWKFQQDAAERAVRCLTGVRGVTNSIDLPARPFIASGDIKQKIFDSFRRNAELDARRVGVDVKEGTVILHGNVSSWAEADAARQAAWAVAGVSAVQNDLSVTP